MNPKSDLVLIFFSISYAYASNFLNLKGKFKELCRKNKVNLKLKLFHKWCNFALKDQLIKNMN